MKKATLFAAIAIVLGLALANPVQAQFHNKGVYLGPNLTLATTPVGFGGAIEFGITPNIGLGALLRYWGYSAPYWKWTIIMPQAQGNYHFMPGNALDPYLGARLGYAIYSVTYDFGYTTGGDDSGVFLNGVGGLRYFFTPNVSVNGSLEFRIAGTDYFGSGLGLLVGVDFTL